MWGFPSKKNKETITVFEIIARSSRSIIFKDEKGNEHNFHVGHPKISINPEKFSRIGEGSSLIVIFERQVKEINVDSIRSEDVSSRLPKEGSITWFCMNPKCDSWGRVPFEEGDDPGRAIDKLLTAHKTVSPISNCDPGNLKIVGPLGDIWNISQYLTTKEDSISILD